MSPPPSAALDSLLDGAYAQFVRHGFVKTTMTDIARAAGVSRTSLYNYFPTKEDVSRALSTRLNSHVLAAVLAADGLDGPPPDRLLAVVHARVGWVYDLLHASDYGRELVNAKNRICGGQVLAANDRFETMVAEILLQIVGETRQASALAAVLVQAVNGVLEAAASKAEAEGGVTLLVKAFARGVASPSA
jgi:AcrR family transcriptional regulator